MKCLQILLVISLRLAFLVHGSSLLLNLNITVVVMLCFQIGFVTPPLQSLLPCNSSIFKFYAPLLFAFTAQPIIQCPENAMPIMMALWLHNLLPIYSELSLTELTEGSEYSIGLQF